MRRKEEPRKECANCKHFTMHFQRCTYNYYVLFKCGECRLRKYSEEEKEKLPYGFVCDKWESREYSTLELKNELTDITAKLILIVKALSK